MRQFLGQALADLALFVTGSFQRRARPRGRESRVAPAIRLLWVPPQGCMTDLLFQRVSLLFFDCCSSLHSYT